MKGILNKERKKRRQRWCAWQEWRWREEGIHWPGNRSRLEKEMATHSSVLAWRIPGMGKPSGLPSMGSHRVGHD